MMRSRALSLLAIGILAACATDADAPTGPGMIGQIGAASPVVYTPGTVTVQPISAANVFTDGWLGFPDRSGANGASVIGTGPALQVLGSGALRIDLAAPTAPQTSTGWEVASTLPPVPAGTPLADITALSYATYTPSSQAGIVVQAVALQFNIDYDVTDSYIGYQSRLVFEPYHCNAMPLDVWNSWNTLDNSAGNTGCWWQTADPSRDTRAPYVGDVQQTAALPCPQSNPCTWDEVKSNYPSAGFHPTNGGGILILKAGSGWAVPSYFYTDALVVGVNGTTTTYDFEPAGPTSTVDASPAPINTAVPFTATLSELNTGGSDVVSYSWSIDGVAQATDVPVATPAVTVSISGNIAASAVPAVKEVCFTAKDASGTEGVPGCALAVWYDPSAGFVTGGGWIDSPAGAYAADPLLSGRASFGFVSKYQKGKSEPTGHTSFQFKAAGLDFQSGSYDWLLISGAKAQYQGTGTINGAGSYRFILTATDGDVNGGGDFDRFRMRIWDGTNTIVYDNQAGDSDTADPVTAIGGGNIMIHKAKK